jgi:hypothetical protein
MKSIRWPRQLPSSILEKGVDSAKDALAGARNVIAEGQVNKDQTARATMHNFYA